MIFKMSNGYYIHVFNKKKIWISEICIKIGHISDAVRVNQRFSKFFNHSTGPFGIFLKMSGFPKLHFFLQILTHYMLMYVMHYVKKIFLSFNFSTEYQCRKSLSPEDWATPSILRSWATPSSYVRSSEYSQSVCWQYAQKTKCAKTESQSIYWRNLSL